MHLEEFAEGDSLIHAIDPRIKVLSLLVLAWLTAVTSETYSPVLALAAGLVLVLAAKVNRRELLVRLCGVNVFIVFLWIVMPFTVPGEELLAVGPFVVTLEGVTYPVMITLKANAIMLLTIALAGTVPVFRLVDVFKYFKVPDKLVFLFFFCYRYMSVLHEEYSTFRRAMKIRAFKPGTDAHTYRSYANLIGMLLVRSYDRSERIHQAMICRGFKGKFPSFANFHLHGIDLLFLSAMFLVSVCIAMVEAL